MTSAFQPSASRARAGGITRRNLIGGAAAGISFLALPGLLAGCSSDAGASSAPSGTPTPGGTLRIAIADVSTVDKLDPAVAFSSTAVFLSSMLYSTLIRTDLDFALVPNLAESWDINADATQWVLHLRQGVTFHDGSPLVADDVVWSLTRLFDESLASPVRGRMAAFLDPSGIVATDDATVTLSLLKPHALFGEMLASYFTGIVKAGESTFDTANGTGPFTLTSFSPGQSFEVAKNPDYWEAGLPYLDGIQNSAIDSSTVLQALGSGSVDWTDALAPKSVAQLAGDARFTSPALEGDQRAVRTYFLHMKLDTAPFDDPRVVTAFKLAADRDAIRQAVLDDLGTISGDVPVPSDDPLYPSSIGERPQNIEEARRLLAEAGYPDGIDIELPTADIQPGMVDFSVAYAETVKEAGIRVTVQQVPVDTYFDRVFGQVPLFHDYAQRSSAYTMLSAFFQQGGAYNGTGFDADGALTAYLDQALATTDADARGAILTEALAYTADNSGTVIPFFVPIVSTARAGVHADVYDPVYSWEKAWIQS